jgi:hypothetical protein
LGFRCDIESVRLKKCRAAFGNGGRLSIVVHLGRTPKELDNAYLCGVFIGLKLWNKHFESPEINSEPAAG